MRRLDRPPTIGRRLAGVWPWLVLAALASAPVWHALDFPEDVDPEFPTVARPTFSPHPPPAYRLAEPGDTIDRVAIYLGSLAVVLAAGGWVARRHSGEPGSGLWPSALALALAALWHAATPGPGFDGWHGLGFRAIANPTAPIGVRLALQLGALGLAAGTLAPVASGWRSVKIWLGQAWRRGGLGLLVVAGVLVAARQVEIPGIEPAGYWPRTAFTLGLAAFGLALIRLWPERAPGLAIVQPRRALFAAGAVAWFALVAGGIGLTWYHRPLARLRPVVPGKIYISAMPTYRGLAIEHKRLGFKTIINLFPEETSQRSPILPDELRFVREHGLNYKASPSGPAGSDAFLDQTLALARDPNAWPILVHCHGCMDRSPAWMGIYRFVVEGRPLDAILQEIEAHRGYRPKASVTLLYNRVLEPRAPGHYAKDPTAQLLKRCASGVRDPYFEDLKAVQGANPEAKPRVFRPSPDGLPRSGRDLDRSDPAAKVPEDRAGPSTPPSERPPMSLHTPQSDASRRTNPPAISSLMQVALANPALVSLAAGFVDQATLPTEAVAREVAALLADPVEGRRALQYGTTHGDPGLRRQLLTLQERADGVEPGAYRDLLPRVVVTTGSAQLLYLVTEALIDPGDIVLVEAPSYFVFLGTLETRGARILGVEVDEGGLRLDALEATLADLEARGELGRVKLIYTVSEHSNPTGISLAADRRSGLVELARRFSKGHRIHILDDAAYRGLVFEGAEPPTVWSHDPDGQTVILARSFSKTLSPGLKLGWGILPTDLLDLVLRLKGNHDFGSANLNQMVVARLLADGGYDRHVGRLIATYRRKRDAMLGALEEHLGPLGDTATWTHPRGGLFVWLTVPEGLDTGGDGPFFARAVERGVLYVPGAYAFAPWPGPVPENCARLSYGVASEVEIVEGIRRLAGALAECLDLVA